MMATGIAAVIAWLRFPYWALIIAGAVVTALGAVSVAGSIRRGGARHEQDILIRKLWAAAKLGPSGYVLTDPDTGELLTVERERSWLSPTNLRPAPSGRDRYPLGQWAEPNPPPMYRHLGALGDVPPARWRWQQRTVLEQLNSQAPRAAAHRAGARRADRPARPVRCFGLGYEARLVAARARLAQVQPVTLP